MYILKRNLCHIPKPLFSSTRMTKKDFDHSLHSISSTERRAKQSQGIRLGFSAQGNAEHGKMRWTVMKRKAENLQELRHTWQETKLLKQVLNKTKQCPVQSVGIKSPETESAKDRSPASRIMLTLVIIMQCVSECPHQVSVYIWELIHKPSIFLPLIVQYITGIPFICCTVFGFFCHDAKA